MKDFTKGELDAIQGINSRLCDLSSFLNSKSFEFTTDIAAILKTLIQIREIQGNTSNDASFIACLMAKDYLCQKFPIGDFDISAKPQGAPGLDIDIYSLEGKRIIGEVKTTIPYKMSKGDFGAQQKASIIKDIDKLEMESADYKYLFVTNKNSYDILRKKFILADQTIQLVLLKSDS